jgi:cyclophilin family peptidyl-prolyl cis-trans isomerase
MGSGTRGARGHGWLKKYRAGLGGRHLQGRYYKRDVKKLVSMNDKVFGLNPTPSKAYLDLNVEGEVAPRRITIELASTALPKTCENFVSLCQDQSSGYLSSRVFKIEKGAGMCLGDISEKNDGTEGKSYASTQDATQSKTFGHEANLLSHAQKGMVSMLSPGLDKNDSRIIITTVDDAPQLDGKLVAFGRVQEGLDDIVDLATNIFTKKGRPTLNIEVVGSGLM